MRWMQLAVGSILFGALAAPSAVADCTSFGGAAVAAAVEPSIVKIQTIGTTQGCTGNGTGFVISSDGLVITAKHVVPQECNDETIVGQIEGDSRIYHLDVVQRSGLDVAILKFVGASRNFPALRMLRPLTNESSYRGRDVVIASFYPEYPDPVVTTARIDSTVVNGEANVWGLCAVAANPGRSGSPVILPDGTVIAVFVERPGGEQDIARVVPIADIRDLKLFNNAPPSVQFVSISGAPLPAQLPSQIRPMLYDFNLAANAAAYRSISDGTGRYIFKDDRYFKADKLSLAQLSLQAIQGGVVRYEDDQVRTFDAPPGYEFDPSVFGLHVASHNPTQAPLPDKPCALGAMQDCYGFSQNHRQLIVHYRLFPGSVPLDLAHGWLYGSISTRLIPSSGK